MVRVSQRRARDLLPALHSDFPRSLLRLSFGELTHAEKIW